MELLLVRHAEPEKLVVASGPADPQLSRRGQAQAERLATYLADEPIEAVYTSPLRRAAQTAAPLAETLGLPPAVRQGLAEFDRHESEYVPLEELRASGDPRYLAMLSDDFSHYGVDMSDFRQGTVQAVEAIIAAHAGGRAVAVCHGGVINAYLGHVLGIERNAFFLPVYTAIHRVAANRSGVRSLVTVNEMGHLRGAGLL